MKLIRSIHLTLIIIILTLPYSVYSETAKTNDLFDLQNGDYNITSDSYELDMKNSIASFKGDVSVVANDINMSCQKLELFFKGSLKDSSREGSKPGIEKIVATESVVISSNEMGNATAEQAVYYPGSEEIVLTGNPYIKYGDKYEGGGMGTVITWNIKEESFHVQGTKENKATAKARIDSGKDEER